MHSRIIQVSKNPIPKEDLISESYFSYDHWFFHIADYIADIPANEWQEEYESFLGNYLDSHIKINYKRNSLKIKDIGSFREKKRKLLAEKAKKLLARLETPGEDYSMALYQLNGTNNDKLGVYIVLEDEYHDSLETLDEWLDSVADGEKYYLGAVIDYHF